ncbi:Uma2 family endonuclease [Leptolyngbya sp. 7M]|uniref:Uma2 family endonuclease n=1 Tax=Leptolyngbya sp. 7M TaxID=2812896 RepID=UPI001B8AD825|nr:Uma2 family endonuclease [Leptolyngbya sp. 7M]QYO65123.1 Uma2 family endonuclease [Leptolyngbya sp. 7M]
MVRTLPESSNLITDVWIKKSWDEFLALAEQSEYEQARFYYDNGLIRIETMPIDSGHSRDNTLLSQVVSLYGTLKNIRIVGFTNGSFRKAGERECQPDLAFYVGADFRIPPKSSEPIDINEFGAPAIAIEIASTTINDDLGRKRLLYERLGIQEYWAVDVNAAEVIAFEVFDGGSRQIQESQVLPGLKITTVEETLKRSQTEDNGAINRWLLQAFM